jgi:hypothetical protein
MTGMNRLSPKQELRVLDAAVLAGIIVPGGQETHRAS